MAKAKKTVVNFILDKSGSMESTRTATISAVNEYLVGLRKDKKSEYNFSLTLFDTEVQQPYVSVPLADVKDLDDKTYIPDGWTALYDAVCKTIKEVEAKVGKDDKVLTIILTDGLENSSKEYTEKEMKAMIERLEKSGNWTFVYLGANQDSYAVAQQYGFKHSNIANYKATASGMRSAATVLASNTAFFSAQSAGNTEEFFSEQDQTNLENS